MKIKKKQNKMARTLVRMKTGTQVHKPSKGKGAYVRVKKVDHE